MDRTLTQSTSSRYVQTLETRTRRDAERLAHHFIMRGFWFNAAKQTPKHSDNATDVIWHFTISDAVDLVRDMRTLTNTKWTLAATAGVFHD